MNWIKTSALLILFFILTLKTVDFLFSFYSQSTDQRTVGINRNVILKEHDPGHIASIVPDDNYLSKTETLEKKPYYVEIDENGFIDNGNERSISNAEILILFFGGSTTEAIFVPEKKRFTSVVERELSKSLKKNVITLNGGVSGNHSLHSLVNFIVKGLQLKPNFVVLMNTMNDLGSLRLTGSYFDAPVTRRLIQINERNQKPVWYLFLKSVKDTLVPNLYAYFLPRLLTRFTKNETDEWRGYRNGIRSYSEFYSSYKASILSFVSVAKAWGVTPILMTQFNRVNEKDKLFRKSFKKVATPGNYDAEILQYVSAYNKFNQIKRDIAKAENIPLIDLDRLVPSTSKYIYDSIHLNEVGSEYVGQIISDFFEKEIVKSSVTAD